MSAFDPDVVCANLRWKGYHTDIQNPERLGEVFEWNSVPYSCLETCVTVGPDDGPVAPERCCGGGRVCFVSRATLS